MPLFLTVKTASDAKRTINRIIGNLKRTSSPDFLASLHFWKWGDDTLDYLKSVFPKGSREPLGHNQKEFGMPLVAGWDVQAVPLGDRISIFLNHALSGDARAAAVLKVLDLGSAAQEITVQKSFTFFSQTAPDGPGFVTFKEGRTINRPKRDGSSYNEETYQYILTTLLPQIKEEIQTAGAASVVRK